MTMTKTETHLGGTRGRVPPMAYVHLMIVYVVWGSTYLAVKVCLTGPAAVTVLQLQTGRLWGATVLLAATAWALSGPPPRLRRSDLTTCVVTGILMWVTGNGLSTLTSRHATSSFIVMALGTIPLWIMAIECLMRRSLPDRRQAGALLLGLFGLGLVVGPALDSTHGKIVDPGYGLLTVLLLMVGGMSWALGTVLQRPLAGRLPAPWAASYQTLTAAIILSFLTFAEGAAVPHGPSTAQLAAFAFLAVFGSAVSLIAYLTVIRSFSPIVASTFAYVNPLVGMGLGHVVLGEDIAPVSLVGLTIVLFSVGIVLTRGSAPITRPGRASVPTPTTNARTVR